MSGCPVFSRLVPGNSKESLFKSSLLLPIDCQLRCVNQTSGSFRSVKQGMDFPDREIFRNGFHLWRN